MTFSPTHSSDPLPEQDDYKYLVELVARAVWETDPQGTVVRDAPAWRTHTGQTLTEWQREGWTGAVHPDDRDYALRHWHEAMRSLQPMNITVRLGCPAGGWRWANVRATAVPNPDGSVKKWLGLSVDVDVAAPESAQAPLPHREQLLHTLVQHLPGGAAFVVDQQLRYQLAEGQALELAGAQPTDFVGKTIFEALTSDTAAHHEPKLRQALAGDPFTDEHQVQDRYFQSTGVPLRDADGNIDAVLVMSYDITERHNVEEALRSNAERNAFRLKLSDAMRSLTDPVAIQRITMEHLAAYFGVNTAIYFEFDPSGEQGAPGQGYRSTRSSASPPIRLADFGPALVDELTAGRLFSYQDAQTDPRLASHRAMFSTLNLRSGLAIPLIKAGHLAAALTVSHTEPRLWTQAEIQLAEDVAERTWAAVERARAQETVRQNDQRYRIQKDAFQSAINGESLASSLNTLTRMVDQQLGSDVRTAFYMVYPDGTSLHAIDGAGSMPRTYTAKMDGFPVGEDSLCSGYAIATGRPSLTRDVFDDPRWCAHLPLALTHNIRACYSYPILTRAGKAIGSFAIYFTDAHDATATDVAVADAVTQAAAIILSRHTEVRERTRAEKALRQSEERFSTLLQNLTDYAIFQLDPAGFITDWTQGAAQVTGYTADEVIGQHLSILFTPDGLAAGEVETELTQASETGRFEGEQVLIRRNGTRIIIEQIITAIHDERGNLTGYAKISRDITERKADQQRLQREQERARIAIEAAGLGTWEWNLQSDQLYWNDHHFELFGMETQAEPLSSEAFMAHIHPDDLNRVRGKLEQAIRKDIVYDTEFRAIRDDNGQTVWMSGYGRTDAQAGHRASRMKGVMFDITERKRAAEALLNSQQHLQIILDSIADHALITSDPANIITRWNAGAQQLFGYAAEEAIGQSAALIFTPEDRAKGEPAREIQTARREGRAPDERYHVRKDSTQLYVSGVVSPLHDMAGQLLGYVKVARDLSERKHMEQALLAADQRKNEFLSMLAHELRNPLAPILNGLQYLALTSSDTSTLDPLLAMMNRQMSHLVRLVDDLLDVSRISRGRIELRREPIDLTQIVSQAADSMRPVYAAAHRQLHVELPDRTIEMDGDATRLSQVVTNLLTNGVRYTQEGGQVWLSLHVTDREAVLEVRDNGIGLAPDQLDAIFELFVRMDTSLARSTGGLGIGLTLVQQLVQMHGGRIEAHSSGINHGSSFVVYLPVGHP
ncbi:PAS domain S-box protein [Spirosoma rhododendri]|uniref:histidine kinase n=1 Tax=Spirosoma rhododendri TaxID=2728024 RepID=A0A7L5DM06_9BACT|nr:PAS domain S-box protein [Spirosoma rhododendri]QJD79499.1 PAS domain S-box protein [Spirosoma rhododendri]